MVDEADDNLAVAATIVLSALNDKNNTDLWPTAMQHFNHVSCTKILIHPSFSYEFNLDHLKSASQ